MIGNGLTAYILAGGGSRRMGADKLFLNIEGESLLERTLAMCHGCFAAVKLVAGSPGKFASLDYPVVIDSPKARGPMAGVIALLEDCEEDHCFVTAADLYDLRSDIIDVLISGYAGQQYFGLRETGGIQPLCGIYHRSALDTVYTFAQNGEYSMMKLVRALDYDAMDIPAGSWRNLNSPEDLAIGGLNG